MSYDSQTEIANRHDFDISYTNEFDTDQTNLTIITPTLGKRIKVTGIVVSGESVAGYVRFHFIPSNNTIATCYAGAGGVLVGFMPLLVTGAVNESISMTSRYGADMNFFVTINYKEE